MWKNKEQEGKKDGRMIGGDEGCFLGRISLEKQGIIRWKYDY